MGTSFKYLYFSKSVQSILTKTSSEFSDFVDFTLVEIEDSKVVVAECQSAGKPVFLKVGKNEEFYIRSGPSNSKLTPSQMIRYVQQKR